MLLGPIRISPRTAVAISGAIEAIPGSISAPKKGLHVPGNAKTVLRNIFVGLAAP
jgi:hypothetical protein